MKNNLAAGFAHMELELVSVKTLFFGKIAREQHHAADQGVIAFRFVQIIHTRNMLFRNDQKMVFGAGVNVVEGDKLLIFTHDRGGNELGGDFAEKTVFH
jgi:hypothetical protein